MAFAQDFREAFERYLGNGKPAFVAKDKLPLAEAIGLIHRAGGLAVLAHPGQLATRERLAALVALGLDGVEVLHPSHSWDESQRLDALAAELELVRSGGSDWHGAPDGARTLGMMRVPSQWLEDQEAPEDQQGDRDDLRTPNDGSVEAALDSTHRGLRAEVRVDVAVHRVRPTRHRGGASREDLAGNRGVGVDEVVRTGDPRASDDTGAAKRDEPRGVRVRAQLDEPVRRRPEVRDDDPDRVTPLHELSGDAERHLLPSADAGVEEVEENSQVGASGRRACRNRAGTNEATSGRRTAGSSRPRAGATRSAATAKRRASGGWTST